MLASPASAANETKPSGNIVQLHINQEERLQLVNVNTLLHKKSHNQPQKRRKKRKRKDESKTNDDICHFKHHSYNHITNDNHIIKTKNNEKRRRKIKSINLVDSNKFNYSRSTITESIDEKNLTLWIFSMKQRFNREDSKDDINDEVNFISF